MRYLVTGAAGFLGFYLARQLAAEAGAEVVVVDNFIRGENDHAYHALCARPNVRGIELDLTDQAAVRSLPDEIDVIFHMAALNGTQNFYERPFEVVRCCVLPTVFLLEKYGPLKPKRFVYAGTSEAYAGTVTAFGWEVPTGEEVPLAFDNIMNARWSYGASKMHGEVATINGCRHFDTPFTIARFHNAYGPRMGDKHVVPDFLMRARAGRFELYGYEDTRAFIYAEDAARATIDLSRAGEAAGEIVNVGGDREITMLELGKLMMKICDFPGEIELFPSPKGSVARRAPKIDKLKRITGFTPLWALEAGLRETAAYYLG